MKNYSEKLQCSVCWKEISRSNISKHKHATKKIEWLPTLPESEEEEENFEDLKMMNTQRENLLKQIQRKDSE
jgi:hypothetical protein